MASELAKVVAICDFGMKMSSQLKLIPTKLLNLRYVTPIHLGNSSLECLMRLEIQGMELNKVTQLGANFVFEETLRFEE